eukprot:CAMPEP_0175078546 /NCGR_PEP_ID=MMETSP0052_2-20121109/24198_1 /TAXON_ID=51329 ORGANISM="Polytomella parva, Strain SAG 63-3" /NCGR_SAMPLE_ID=MMETSP0052_2 /ASSEMBLY_ACC=CAM_ASM_000194 /LENGTH=631 /DNA_ID=CAMNT_0016348519 /DNA_START=354 /DNA_END=2246 /DNA_ORIENTATION=+
MTKEAVKKQVNVSTSSSSNVKKSTRRISSPSVFKPERDYAQLLKCLNENQPQVAPTSRFSIILRNDSRYKVVKIWSSNLSVSADDFQPVSPSTLQPSLEKPNLSLSNVSKLGRGLKHKSLPLLTLVTQLTFDRKAQLEAMCKSFKGPVAAVVFQPLVQNTTYNTYPSNSVPHLANNDALIRPKNMRFLRSSNNDRDFKEDEKSTFFDDVDGDFGNSYDMNNSKHHGRSHAENDVQSSSNSSFNVSMDKSRNIGTDTTHNSLHVSPLRSLLANTASIGTAKEASDANAYDFSFPSTSTSSLSSSAAPSLSSSLPSASTFPPPIRPGPLDFTVNNLSRDAYEHLTSLINDIDDFMNFMRHSTSASEEYDGCDLTIMLVTEVYRTTKARRWFPINLLRNYGRMLAYTPYIAALDVDLIVSKSLVRNLAAAAKGDRAQSLLMQTMDAVPPVAVVLPAFIAARDVSLRRQLSMADAFAGMSKAQLRLYYDLKKLQPFDPDTVGHRPTNYRQWFRTTTPYQVAWRSRYEPWFMCNRLRCMWADVRFRGYGKNKITYALSAVVDGFKLVIHPSSFIVHRAHVPSVAAISHAESSLKKIKDGMMFVNTRLYRDVLDEMDNGTYVPKLDPATEKCRKSLW